MIRNLGKALSIILTAEAAEVVMHEDLAAFHAPGECHILVAKNEKRRLRAARRHAEAVAQAPLRVIARQATKRGFQWSGPKYERIFGRIYAKLSPWSNQ